MATLPGDQCPHSRRDDGKHDWHFDGDDPYCICSFCECRIDALKGHVIYPGRLDMDELRKVRG